MLFPDFNIGYAFGYNSRLSHEGIEVTFLGGRVRIRFPYANISALSWDSYRGGGISWNSIRWGKCPPGTNALRVALKKGLYKNHLIVFDDIEDTAIQLKAGLRNVFQVLLQSLSNVYIERSNREIESNLLALEQWKQAKSVFIFVSTGREPETRGLIQAALDAGKTVAVPRCLAGGEMEARVIVSPDDLRPGHFGIPEPAADSRLLQPEELSLVVAPCVAADRQGYRLGHGGGYYDRYLARVQCPAVCLCHGKLLQTSLPHTALDRPVDIIVSEEGCIP